MTEAEWLACEDARAMLRHLRGVASERKLRLLTLAWVRAALAAEECRRFGPLLHALIGMAEDANGAAMEQIRERADFVGVWNLPPRRAPMENLFMALTQGS